MSEKSMVFKHFNPEKRTPDIEIDIYRAIGKPLVADGWMSSPLPAAPIIDCF